MRSRRYKRLLRGLVVLGLFVAGLMSASLATGRPYGTLSFLLTKSHTPEPAAVGQPVTFALTVTNSSTTPVTTVSAYDNLPSGFAYVSGSAGCSASESVVTCPVPDVPGPGSRVVTIVATPSTTGAFVNSAYATGDTCGDGCMGTTPTWSDTVNVGEAQPPPPPPAEPPPPPPPPPPPADVTLVVELSPAQPVAGEILTIRSTVTNNGPNDALNVSVLSQAPAGATEASGTTSKGSCVGTIDLACTIGTLSATASGAAKSLRLFAAGESAQVVQRVRIPSAGPATALVTLQTSSTDPNPVDNRSEATVAVLATAPSQPPPPPSPPPPPPANDDGQPNPNETVVVQELSGRVLVKLPGSDRFVDLTTLSLRELPNGTVVDATNGRFRLLTAAPDGQQDLSEFYEGVVQIVQTAPSSARLPAQGAEPGTTQLTLTGGNFGKPCTTALAKAKPKPKAKKKAKRSTAGVAQTKPVKPVRRLWGNGSGKFRTRGRFASATVRGTIWLTEDYCNGTLIRVREGAVTVRDLVKNRTVIVRAGKSYFAEAPARKSAR